MFAFVVKHLRWLTKVPGLPQCFDALLLAWTAVFHQSRLAAIELIEANALQFPGIELRVHRFGGMEFTLGGRELGHLHGNGLLDVRVGGDAARTLVRDGAVEPHHVLGESAWVSFWVKRVEDVPQAMALLKLAERTESWWGEATDEPG